jgi:hypothetical protein
VSRIETDLARADMCGVDADRPLDVGDAEQDSVRVGSSTRAWSKTP